MNDAKVIREVGGELVLVDPATVGVPRAVQILHCRATLDGSKERVSHFRERIRILGKSPQD